MTAYANTYKAFYVYMGQKPIVGAHMFSWLSLLNVQMAITELISVASPPDERSGGN